MTQDQDEIRKKQNQSQQTSLDIDKSTSSSSRHSSSASSSLFISSPELKHKDLRMRCLQSTIFYGNHSPYAGYLKNLNEFSLPANLSINQPGKQLKRENATLTKEKELLNKVTKCLTL